MIKAVIFDMDGVIINTEGVTAGATVDMFRQLYGAEVKKKDFLPFVGTGAKKYIMGVAEKYNVSVNRNMVPILCGVHQREKPNALVRGYSTWKKL